MPQGTTKKSFLNKFIKDYKVAALSPSSRFLVKKILTDLNTPLNLVIEQGAGNGVLTFELLKKLSPSGKYIVIEQNKEFLAQLSKIKDSRLVVWEGLAQAFAYEHHLHGKKADLIISSIPFSFLKKQERDTLCAEAYQNLAHGGKFIIFHQYSILMKEIVKKYFGAPNVQFILWNIFPCFIIKAAK